MTTTLCSMQIDSAPPRGGPRDAAAASAAPAAALALAHLEDATSPQSARSDPHSGRSEADSGASAGLASSASSSRRNSEDLAAPAASGGAASAAQRKLSAKAAPFAPTSPPRGPMPSYAAVAAPPPPQPQQPQPQPQPMTPNYAQMYGMYAPMAQPPPLQWSAHDMWMMRMWWSQMLHAAQHCYPPPEAPPEAAYSLGADGSAEDVDENASRAAGDGDEQFSASARRSGSRRSPRGGGGGGGAGSGSPRSAHEDAKRVFAAALQARALGGGGDAACAKDALAALRRSLAAFEQPDPFNPDLLVTGLQCRREGDLMGSTFFTHVNGAALPGGPLMVWGQPLTASPFADFARTRYVEFARAAAEPVAFALTPLPAGISVTLFRYRVGGEERFSLKGRGVAFLQNNEKSQLRLLDVVRGLFGLSSERPRLTLERVASALPRVAELLRADAEVQSVACELIGGAVQSIVRCAAPLRLVPLYATRRADGAVLPLLDASVDRRAFSQRACEVACDEARSADLAANRALRGAAPAPSALELDSFASAGHLLFLLARDGTLAGRAVFEVRPADVDAAAGAHFDEAMELRVRGAVRALQSRGGALSGEELRREMALGPKQWSRYGKAIVAYAEAVAAPRHAPPLLPAGPDGDTRMMVVLTGPPGSGKTHFAHLLAPRGAFLVVNQEELGSRHACEAAAATALANGRSVIVDRTNVDVAQRSVWLALAARCRVRRLVCVVFRAPPALAKDRVAARAQRPSLATQHEAGHCVDLFFESFVPPCAEEGFARVAAVGAAAEDAARVAAELSA
jgi:hypothetical protein